LNWRQIGIGLGSLIIGALVYIIDRPPEETYFIYRLPFDISLHDRLPQIFGPIGNVLPDFLHVFAFILITAGVLNTGRRGQVVICICWLSVDTLFEVGQRFRWLADMVPVWFAQVPFLENTANYFRYGSFDSLDLVAIALGTAAAYGILRLTSRSSEKPWRLKLNNDRRTLNPPKANTHLSASGGSNNDDAPLSKV